MSTTLAQLRSAGYAEDNTFQRLLSQPSTFNPDAYHVMQERDNALIRDEIMHGAASKAFVYSFSIKGSTVTGISVVGARELASQYKGIKSRIVATVEKRGALFIFRSFNPLNIETRVLPELEQDEDFYECVMEVSDIKTGNSIEVRKKEAKTEKKRDGGFFERPHYDVIAESKAYRNGVLSVLPQSVIKDFQKKCLEAGNTSSEETIDQRRSRVQTFATKNGIALSRTAVNELSYAELDGLGGAARESLEAFRSACAAVGILAASEIADRATGEIPPPAARAAAKQAPAPAQRRAAPHDQQDDPRPDPDPAPAAAPAQAQATTTPGFDVDAFATRLEACKDVAALDAMAADIREMQDLEVAQTLNDIYLRCRAVLVPAGPARRSAGRGTQASIE